MEVTSLLFLADVSGLSPSLHWIDQIKVLDRFRGTSFALSHAIDAEHLYSSNFPRDSSRGAYGRPCLVRPRSRQGRFRNVASVLLVWILN